MVFAFGGSGGVSQKTSARRGRLLPISLNAFGLSLTPRGPKPFTPRPGTVGTLMRFATPLTPVDKIASAHDSLRKASSGALCMVFGGRVLGALSLAELDRALSHPAWPGSSSLATSPMSDLMAGPEPVLSLRDCLQLKADAPIAAARSLFEERPNTPLIAIVTETGHYAGILLRSDLVAADLHSLVPMRVGGMATPLGVYLTDGVVQGGAGNVGLILSGMTMSLLYTIALIATNLGLTALESRLHVNALHTLSMTFLRLNPTYIISLDTDLRAALALVVMLALLRLLPIAGYHAAEHQVVHCLERGEPLSPETVRRMPRAHPRCGTNLVAAVSIFSIALSAIFGATVSILESVVPALLITLFAWRPLGKFLQERLTTRPASDKQIISGIRAGQEVVRRHLHGGIERRATALQRIWNMGLIQMMLGAYVVTGTLELIITFVPGAARYAAALGL